MSVVEMSSTSSTVASAQCSELNVKEKFHLVKLNYLI